MAHLRRSIDAVNGQIQFEVTENANSVNLKFNPEFSQHIENLKVRVEKITKNATDRVLYSGTMKELREVLKFAFPKMQNFLPFAIGKSLILSDEDKLVVTLSFDSDAQEESRKPTSFEYELNKYVETTQNPLVIKKVTVDEELSFSSEFYPFVMLPQNTESYETVVMAQTSNNVSEPRKIFLGNQLINSAMQPDHTFLAMVTSPNQNLTVKGNCSIYLILA